MEQLLQGKLCVDGACVIPAAVEVRFLIAVPGVKVLKTAKLPRNFYDLRHIMLFHRQGYDER